jgi:predicted nucleotidyltransferase
LRGVDRQKIKDKTRLPAGRDKREQLSVICLILIGLKNEIEYPIDMLQSKKRNMKKTREELLQSIKEVLLSAVPNGKVILFGSRARGDAREDSDWDLLILLDKPQIEASDFDRISYPLYELGWSEGEQFSPKLYTIKDWLKRSFTPFFKNIEKEGIIL